MSTLKKTENNLGQDEKVRSLWKQSVIQFKHNRLAVVGLVIIVLFIVTILTTLAVDQITNYSFYNEYIIKQDLSLRLAKPSLAHPFGCDEFGRDLLLRILWGTKLSFAIGVVAIALSVIMGAPFGMIAAFYGGKTDNAIMRVMDVLLAVPYMLLAMAIVAALGTSTFNLLLALAVSGIAKYARIARAAVLTVKDSEFVEAPGPWARRTAPFCSSTYCPMPWPRFWCRYPWASVIPFWQLRACPTWDWAYSRPSLSGGQSSPPQGLI